MKVSQQSFSFLSVTSWATFSWFFGIIVICFWAVTQISFSEKYLMFLIFEKYLDENLKWYVDGNLTTFKRKMLTTKLIATTLEKVLRNKNMIIRSFVKCGFNKPKRLSIDYSISLKFSWTIVTRNNIVWKLAHGYGLCYCKTFSLVPDSVQYIICTT